MNPKIASNLIHALKEWDIKAPYPTQSSIIIIVALHVADLPGKLFVVVVPIHKFSVWNYCYTLDTSVVRGAWVSVFLVERCSNFFDFFRRSLARSSKVRSRCPRAASLVHRS